jgi:uncharacterized protein (DUF2236 family)
MARPAPGALYDARSLAWRMNRQSFVLLGGPRAAILQVCDPGVAAGVAQYSSYRADPLGRLERTLESMLAISFGSPGQREATLAGLERAHRAVSGDLGDGTPYSAMEPDRQFWVLATLTDTVIEVDRRYLGWLRPADRARYYEESKRLATAFGVPESLVPAGYDDFRDYMAEKVATLVPTEASVDITRSLMAPRIPLVPAAAWVPFNLVTTDLLPRRLQHLLGIRDLNAAELATVRATQVWTRNSVAHLAGAWTDNPLSGRVLRNGRAAPAA